MHAVKFICSNSACVFAPGLLRSIKHLKQHFMNEGVIQIKFIIIIKFVKKKKKKV